MIQEKYSFPLPNCGEDYKLTKEELISLLDAAWQNGYDTVSRNFDTKVGSLTICDKCHDIIEDDEDYTEVTAYDLDGNKIVSHWCAKCKGDFIRDIETPAFKSFSEVKPHASDMETMKKNVERYLGIVKNKNPEGEDLK